MPQLQPWSLAEPTETWSTPPCYICLISHLTLPDLCLLSSSTRLSLHPTLSLPSWPHPFLLNPVCTSSASHSSFHLGVKSPAQAAFSWDGTPPHWISSCLTTKPLPPIQISSFSSVSFIYFLPFHYILKVMKHSNDIVSRLLLLKCPIKYKGCAKGVGRYGSPFLPLSEKDRLLQKNDLESGDFYSNKIKLSPNNDFISENILILYFKIMRNLSQDDFESQNFFFFEWDWIDEKQPWNINSSKNVMTTFLKEWLRVACHYSEIHYYE